MKTNFCKTLIMTAAVAGGSLMAAWGGIEHARELRTGPRTSICDAPGQTVMKKITKAQGTSSYEAGLIGFVYYSSAWETLEGNTPFGIYTISTKPGSQPEPFARIGMANSHCNGGAVLVDDTYWYIWRQTDPTGSTGIDISQLYSYNINTGVFSNHGMVTSELASTSDKTWDPITGNVYAQHVIEGIRMLTIDDYHELTVTPIGPCDQFYGLACSSDGQLYGINSVGDLCKVDKTTGTSTKIGSTGITPKYAQSMAMDPRTGDIWWAGMCAKGSDSAYSVLYKVNPETGNATKVTDFNNQEEIFGLAVIPSEISDGAPGYATGLSLEIAGDSSDGTLSFSLPQYTYMGEPLTGDIAYTLAANGNMVKTGNGAAGEAISQRVTLPQGSVELTVTCSNTYGNGPSASLTRWVGPGYPLAPQNVEFTLDHSSGKAVLTWDAVTEGLDGGYINPEQITYKVMAYPGERIAASGITGCSFTETIEQPERPLDTYYKVIACNDWRESEPAESNHFAFGKGLNVPYDNSFDSAEDLTLFTIIDGNEDGSTWTWSKHRGATAYLFTATNATQDQDDWLITPGLEMKAGNRYCLTYFTKGNLGGAKYTDHLEVTFGKGYDTSEYEVVQEKFLTDGTKEVRHDVIVNVTEDGYYNFGFHCVSNCKTGLAVDIDDIHIDVMANAQAPAECTDINVRTNEGTAPVNFTFTTPKVNASGEKLDNVTRVELWKNLTQLVDNKETSGTGKRIVLTDKQGGNGMTNYQIVAYNEHGVGKRAEVNVFLGVDYPGKPGNITLSDVGNGTLKLTWETPEKGANGGWFDADNVTYNVYSVINGYAVDYQKGVKDKELTVSAGDAYYNPEQELTLYAVAAQNSVGEGNIYTSTEVLIGKPYAYPFTESWAEGTPQHNAWYRASSGSNGWLPYSGDFASDNDNGSICFAPAATGDMSYIYLGKVDMSKASIPALLFDYYAYPGTDSFIIPEINRAFRDGWATAPAIEFSALEGEPGWRQCVVGLGDFKSYLYISVRFLGTSDPLHPLYIDNVRIMDSTAGIGAFAEDAPEVNSPVYHTLDGIRIDRPVRGSVCVARYPDGSVRKIIR